MSLKLNNVYQGNNLELIKKLEDNSIDSIVTDSPYEIALLSKAWDSSGISYNVALWKECYRVLKPGGYLLSFSASRTYHKIATAIEDAGFEIRDQIAWCYGQGMAKAQDIGKVIDKQSGEENESEWNGWKNALKPSQEPIIVAQKPIKERTIALNILKWRTGAFNIAGSKIPLKSEQDKKTYENNLNGQLRMKEAAGDNLGMLDGGWKVSKEHKTSEGRFPTNLILDDYMAVEMDKQGGYTKSNKPSKTLEDFKEGINHVPFEGGFKKLVRTGFSDKGGVSRYFLNIEREDLSPFYYCSKVTKKERGEYNNHVCVKPRKLIKYLVKLCTAPGGISLDIFSGSGTHGLACIELTTEGYPVNFIEFEMEQEYVDIANKRIREFEENL